MTPSHKESATVAAEPKRRLGVIVPVGVTVAIMFMGAGIVPLAFRPLDYLGIAYPPALRYAHVILPAVFLVVCLLFNRSDAVAIVAFVLATTAMGGVAQWAEAQPAKIRVTRTVGEHEFDGWLKTVGFPVWQMGDKDGPQMWVDRTPGRVEWLTAESKRLGIWRP